MRHVVVAAFTQRLVSICKATLGILILSFVRRLRLFISG